MSSPTKKQQIIDLHAHTEMLKEVNSELLADLKAVEKGRDNVLNDNLMLRADVKLRDNTIAGLEVDLRQANLALYSLCGSL